MCTYRELTAERIRRRAQELGYTMAEVHRATGSSYRTVEDTFKARSQLKHRQTAWEDLFQWEHGSIDRSYLTGAEPQEVDQLAAPDDEDPLLRALMRSPKIRHEHKQILRQMIEVMYEREDQTPHDSRK